ncbi:MAG: chemotaxis protein CheW, partial [Polyangiales bacterium]
MSTKSDVDWPALHARLAQAAARREEALHPSAERVQRILEERARLLARPVHATAPAHDTLELLVCALGDERCALETRSVLHAGRAPRVTGIPGVPSPFVGIANHAGGVIPVIDLGAVLDLPVASSRAVMLVVGT